MADQPIILTGSDGADTLRGADGRDSLYGGKGDDKLYGGEGNDWLYGGPGADVLDGGAGVDWVFYTGSSAGVTITFSEVTRTINGEQVTTYEGAGLGGDAAGDRLVNVEVVVGSDHNDRLEGGKGIDDLRGGKGNDYLYGGAGFVDWLYGGPGADVLDGGAGHDRALYRGSSAGVTITFSEVTRTINGEQVTTYEGAGLGGDAEGDRLINVESVSGSEHNDRLYGGKGNDSFDGGGGGDDQLYGGPGDDFLSDGAGDDQLYGGAGDDHLLGGPDNDKLYGNAGHDLLGGGPDSDKLYGNAGDDFLSGDGGDDQLDGGEGHDTLNGGEGADTLNGGAGLDTLNGGAGNDILRGGAGLDTISYAGSDAAVDIRLSTGHASGGHAKGDEFSEVESILGSAHNDRLEGDANDNALTGGAGADRLYGGGGDDSLYGGAGNDRLEGMAGDDHLYGGEGADQLYGGAGWDGLKGGPGADVLDGGAGGSDVVFYEDSSAGVTITFSEVTRTINGEQVTTYEGAGSGGDAAGDRLINVEQVHGSYHNDRLYGGKGNDYLTGGFAGDDQLYGGAGDDILSSHYGNDQLHGGAGDDRLYGGPDNDKLYGNAGNDFLGDDEGDDQLDGGEGNDWLVGREGADTLTGGAGDDKLNGGAGNDILRGGAGVDTISYAGSDAAVDIRLSTGHASGGHAKGDTFSAVESIIGSAHNDRLEGDANDNELTGGEGDDQLKGGAGDDWLYGGEGNDFLSGNYGDDWLHGGKGADRLYGGAGNDILRGGAGDDQLYAGNGDDWLEGGAGADSLNGGAGNDTISYWHSDAGVDIRLSAGHASGGHAKGDAFSEVENIIGSHYNDRLEGDANDNELIGDAGDDTLYGGAGNDRLVGGAVYFDLEDEGRDHLYGGAGDDQLYGGRGDDRLEGGAGADTLTGGERADTLTGGAGADIFRFERGDSLGSGDVITDFTVAGANRDALDLRAFNIDLARNLESQGLTLSDLMDADGDGATDDRKITLPDSGTITLLNLGDVALAIDDFTFAGDGGALTNVDAGDGAGVPSWRSHLQEVVTSGGLTGRLDAGDLSIGGGVDLPASDDGLHRSNYHLYYRADGGSYFLRFDDAVTADLPVGATAAQVDAALEGLDGITSAEVTGEPGNFTIALTADEPHVLQWGDLRLDGDGQLDYLAEPPADDGDGGALTNVDAGDEPEAQPDPDPEGDGGALTGTLINVEAGDEPEVLPPQKSILQQHLNLLELIIGGATGSLDAGALSIVGGVDLPASDDGLHRSSYHLYYRADGGSYFLRFDDAVTADLPVGATAAQVDAALEGLDGVTSAEVTGEPGNFTIALTADEPHVLQWGDLRLDGDGSLDYLIA